MSHRYLRTVRKPQLSPRPRAHTTSLLLERDGLVPRVLVDAAHHGLELLARAGLDVLRVAARDEVLGALLPFDALEELALEERLDLVDGRVGLAGDVGVDLDGGHLDV